MLQIYDSLQKLDITILGKYLPLKLKNYLPESINKKSIVDYIYLNFDMFIEKKEFILDFISVLDEDTINLLRKNLIFENDNLSNNSLKYIRRVFSIKNEIEKKDKIVTQTCLLPKRFYELLDYQFLIKEKVCNYVLLKNNNGEHINKLIIHMPTGTGKTKTCVHTCVSLYQKNKNKGAIVWLAHTEELLKQAQSSFISVWNALGNRDISIIYNDTLTIKEDNAIYFLSYSKLIYFYKSDSEAYKNFRKNMTICVCDEAHKCLANETYYALDDFMLSFNKNHSKTLIGLTATPGRKYHDSLNDGDNLDLALMFDKHIFSIDTNDLEIFHDFYSNKTHYEFSYKNIYSKDDKIIKYFQDRGVLAKIKRCLLEYDEQETKKICDSIIAKKHNNDYSNEELRIIGDSISRNKKILENIIKLANSKFPTIVFACSNEQGQLLSDVLTLNGINNRCIFGETRSDLRQQYLADFESGKYDILINNMILTTGFDSPRIKCVFITRPTNSIVLYSQMLGRGLRGTQMGGNDTCLLIDIKDNLTKFSDENVAFNYFSEYWR